MDQIKIVDDDLEQRLIDTNDQQEINDVMNVINLNLKKKQAIRATTYSELQDKVTQEISDRLKGRSGEFTNKELLDFLTAFDTIQNKHKVEKIDVPQIAIQNNISVDGSTLDQDSRMRIQKYIQGILSDKETISINGEEEN